MKTFTDISGRIWTITVTVDTIKRVRSLTDTNLLDLTNGKLMQELADDTCKLVDVLFAVCKPEADSKNITDEDFGRSLAGDATDNAQTALFEELVDFFPSRKRHILRDMLAKVKLVEDAAEKKAMTLLNDPRMMEKMQESLEAAYQTALQSLETKP